MVPSGPRTPIGGAQSVNPSVLRTNNGMLGGGQGGSMPSQGAFSGLVSPRTQFNNPNGMGNVPNASLLLNQQSFGNGGSNPRGGIDGGAESDSLSSVRNGMAFNSPSSFMGANMVNSGSSSQGQGQQFSSPMGNQVMPDQPPQSHHQLEHQNFQQPQSQSQSQSQPQQFQSGRGGIGSVNPVKMEPQVTSSDQQQHQLQSMRGLGPVKMEPQNSDQSVYLQQQQQQQQFLQQMSRQSSQTAAQFMQQQRLLQLQQQQQNQLLKASPQQRAQFQQQFQSQNQLSVRTPVKPYEPGMCARRLTHYMYQQQRRPEDNNIEFWRSFVAEFFAPNAKKKWCVSMYGSGRQTTGVFPQDVWHCEICKRKPGRGFEATVEVLPRLYKIKYESGTQEELLSVDMPREYQNSLGQIVLDYAKATQESVFEQLRVVRDGQLRVVFSPDLKICSWEFCARRHEELIPRRLLIPQVSQLGTVAQKYQAAAQNSSANMSASDLQSNCNMFAASARQLAKTLEVPLVNDLGYTKRYIRCLQISEVVNSMKDLIDYTRVTKNGPMESLAKFARTPTAQSGPQGQSHQPDEQQQQQQQPHTMIQSPNNNDESSVQGVAMQIDSTNGPTGVNNSIHVSSASTPNSTITGLHPMNTRQQMGNVNSPYGGGGGGSSVQMPSPGGSSNTTIQQSHPNPSFPPTPSSSNNNPQSQTSHGTLGATTTNTTTTTNYMNNQLNGEGDMNDNHNSVQKIIQDMMMNNQLNGGGGGGMMGMGSLGNDMKNMNGGILPTSRISTLNGMNGSMGNGPMSGNSSMGSGVPFGGGGGGGMAQSSVVNGTRVAIGNNTAPMNNGRVGMPSMVRDQNMNHQAQQDMGNQMLNGLGSVNGFNNMQFDWKPSP